MELPQDVNDNMGYREVERKGRESILLTLKMFCSNPLGELISTRDHTVPESKKSSCMDRTGDGEDGEEEEDELRESPQHTVLLDSQDLFITLTEIPSQPHKAGEGTSAAANVSSLPPPSQRLSQIRRRKKRTRDEMFSELMQSSGTDTSAEYVEGHNSGAQESGQ
ncbi:hypothetical protein UY3_10601 [Chelonia mydas]|uniref:Uncharacterized protein n=1 Tax=Chelonia mydas TaxID=8469 RepID=M7B9M9_CHEMY|nr:hypothetical protein UY3_10601 [Chelonia mydas]